MNTYTVKRGDTLRPIEATLLAPDGAAQNLSGCAVKFIMRLRGAPSGYTPKVNAAAVVHDAANGVVRYEWTANDVDTAGEYLAEWEVTSSTKKETYPSDGYHEIRVVEDLG